MATTRIDGSRPRTAALVLTLTLAAAAGAGALLVRAQAPGATLPYDARGNMSPELTARVERLLADVAAAPTTQDTLRARADVLWDWVNALALQGVHLPTEAPSLVGWIRSYEALDLRTAPPLFDALVRELRLKTQQPTAIGPVAINVTGPMRASSWTTIEQTYTVGSMSMQEGGGVLVAKEVQNDHGALQRTDPKGDNYLTIRSSNPTATFEPFDVSVFGAHGGLYAPVNLPAWRLKGTSLAPGETVTVVYGDTSGGSRGFRVQTFENDMARLPIYVDLEGRGHHLSPVWPSFRVVGGSPHDLLLVAPSIVKVAEPFEVSVRTQDLAYNRATGPIPAYTLSLDGKVVRQIPASQSGLAMVDGVRIDAPGVYRFEARSLDGTLTGRSNPVWVQEAPQRRLYWGETHGHTSMAEGQGSVENYYRYSREDARLDFATISEHDLWMDDREWKELTDAAVKYTEPGRFVAYLGYEWTQQRVKGGHHNVLFRTPDRRRRINVQFFDSISRLFFGLNRDHRAADVLTIPHAHEAADWRVSDPELERLVEMYSMHGTFEWFGNRYLKQGLEVGFVAASDDHRGRPGYSGTGQGALRQFGGLAGVYATEKTVDGIFDAMRSLSAYAVAAAQRIVLDVSLDGAPMGRRLAPDATRSLRVRVLGTAPIDTIDIVRNGDVVARRRFLDAAVAPRVWLRVGFESQSDALTPSNPRGLRPWMGTVRVDGARVLAVRTPGFDARVEERAMIDAANPSLVKFSTRTRGREDVMLLELEGANPDTTLTFDLESGRETNRNGPLTRPLDTFPAAQFALSLGSMKEGEAARDLPLGDYTDRVSLRLVRPDGALDQEFEFTDLAPGRDGDYYYVRVLQLDGNRAWSSPWWVGGSRPR